MLTVTALQLAANADRLTSGAKSKCAKGLQRNVMNQAFGFSAEVTDREAAMQTEQGQIVRRCS